MSTGSPQDPLPMQRPRAGPGLGGLTPESRVGTGAPSLFLRPKGVGGAQESGGTKKPQGAFPFKSSDGRRPGPGARGREDVEKDSLLNFPSLCSGGGRGRRPTGGRRAECSGGGRGATPGPGRPLPAPAAAADPRPPRRPYQLVPGSLRSWRAGAAVKFMSGPGLFEGEMWAPDAHCKVTSTWTALRWGSSPPSLPPVPTAQGLASHRRQLRGVPVLEWRDRWGLWCQERTWAPQWVLAGAHLLPGHICRECRTRFLPFRPCSMCEFADLALVLENRASSSRELPAAACHVLPSWFCLASNPSRPESWGPITTEGQPCALQQSDCSCIEARCQTVTFHQNMQQPSPRFP
ncbi:hypothetical protein MC885_015781 [Smutsia gigantea]|nr:hypothetical protein MC885_015781 [Smutsia gigantea]